MVVLAASICTRGGKAVLSRHFREMPRSRVEALLASFPKLADSGTQHTTVEQDNVRYVYQPLDELYMVLITNRQSNILQDIDSLHLFAQVVTSICRSLDEREILKNAFELLSAFDELVNLGYRENLTLTQIKTFLEMESHEERVALIIESNKQQEANEQRKLKAKQLEMQRREQTRAGRTIPRTPTYPTYTAPVQPAVVDTIDNYAAEKNKTFKSSAPLGKGMQLGKKSKSTNMFDAVRSEFNAEEEASASTPLVSTPAPSAPAARSTPTASSATNGDASREAVNVTFSETISAKLSREGAMESFEVKGDLHLRISDSSLTQVKLDLSNVATSSGTSFMVHPNVDKQVFNTNRVIQLKNTAKGFPVNNSIGVMRWRYNAPSGADVQLPLTLTAWVNPGADDTYSITLEYELTGGDTLNDVVVTIPFSTSEPAVASFDAVYEVTGDSLDWTIGTIDESNSSGSFEFEAQSDGDAAFFPMSVRFTKTQPWAGVDVETITLIGTDQPLTFGREVKSTADKYVVG